MSSAWTWRWEEKKAMLSDRIAWRQSGVWGLCYIVQEEYKCRGGILHVCLWVCVCVCTHILTRNVESAHGHMADNRQKQNTISRLQDSFFFFSRNLWLQNLRDLWYSYHNRYHVLELTIQAVRWTLYIQFNLIFPPLESGIFMSRKLRCRGYRNKISYEKLQRWQMRTSLHFSMSSCFSALIIYL